MYKYVNICKRSTSSLLYGRGNKVVYTLEYARDSYVSFQNKNTFFHKSWFLACLPRHFVTSKVLRCRLTFFFYPRPPELRYSALYALVVYIRNVNYQRAHGYGVG